MRRFTTTIAGIVVGLASASAVLAQPAAPVATESRDGAHDFDFNLGVWRTQITRRVHPLSGSSEFFEMTGTVTVRPVWGGRGQLEEIEADGPRGHWQALTLFLYQPQTRRWTQTFVNSQNAEASSLVGAFSGGRGELFARDELGGRPILVRGTWSDITPDAHRYEESYSADDGRTWEQVFVGQLTRLSAVAPPPVAAAGAASHDFDFEFGAWDARLRRLVRPLAHANDWVQLDGRSTVVPVWGGSANLGEFAVAGASGRIDGLSLRIFDPKTKQWSIYWANASDGELTAPLVGAFRDGRGEFINHDTFAGRPILVRFVIAPMQAGSFRLEQAFSDDEGATWENNWIADFSRPRS